MNIVSIVDLIFIPCELIKLISNLSQGNRGTQRRKEKFEA